MVPDSYLVAAGLADTSRGAAYDPANYAGHGSGLFVVGVEGTGALHLFALDLDAGAASLIQTVGSGQRAVMGLEFDRDTHQLWTVCDNTCDNQLTVLALDETGVFAPIARFAPPSGLPNSNNEGLAFATELECVDGDKAAFWSDDSNFDSHALRQGAVSCGGI